MIQEILVLSFPLLVDLGDLCNSLHEALQMRSLRTSLKLEFGNRTT